MRLLDSMLEYNEYFVKFEEYENIRQKINIQLRE